MVQRLGLWGCKGGASAAGDEDSIPGQGTKIPQASHMGGGGCRRHTHTWFAGLHPKYSDSVGLGDRAPYMLDVQIPGPGPCCSGCPLGHMEAC